MRKADLYDANGRFLRTLGEDEGNYIVKDGESIRVPLNMLDSVQRDIMQHALTPRGPMRAPGFVQVSDSDYESREQRFLDHKQRLSDAWKHPPALNPSDGTVKPEAAKQPTVASDADTAYERRNAALELAWRGGA